MKKQRKRYTQEEKVAILRRHLVGEGADLGSAMNLGCSLRFLPLADKREARKPHYLQYCFGWPGQGSRGSKRMRQRNRRPTGSCRRDPLVRPERKSAFKERLHRVRTGLHEP